MYGLVTFCKLQVFKYFLKKNATFDITIIYILHKLFIMYCFVKPQNKKTMITKISDSKAQNVYVTSPFIA
jgi:hypothetical protein